MDTTDRRHTFSVLAISKQQQPMDLILCPSALHKHTVYDALPAPQVLQLCLDIAKGVQELHTNRILNDDIKVHLCVCCFAVFGHVSPVSILITTIY
jgi:serine/threonine protein kinase